MTSKFEYGSIKALQPVSDKQKRYIIYLLKKNNQSLNKYDFSKMMADDASDIIYKLKGGI